MPLHATPDRRLVRSGVHSTRYVRILLTAPEAPRRTERLPLDLGLVVDRSGSMSGPKLELARLAAHRATDLLGPGDRLALVDYDDEVRVLAEGQLVADDHRTRLHRAIDQVEAGGSTNLSGGWLTGCEEVARGQRPDAVARTILLSDGLANVGITDPAALEHHAGQLRTRGVVTSTIGIGADFDERLMEGMARAGGGNFYYLERAEQIPDFLASELGDALEVVARDARLIVTADPGLRVESLDDRRTERRGPVTEIALHDLVSRQRLELVLKVTFPHDAPHGVTQLSLGLTDRDGALANAMERVRWEYADHAANDAQPRDVEVDRAVASRYAARAREAAAECNRRGDLVGAQEVLRRTASRIREYAGTDPEMRKLVSELRVLADRHAHRFENDELKRERFEAYNIREAKSLLGLKMRSNPE